MNELIENLITLLQTQFTTTFKYYNYGVVKVPGQSSLPAIYVVPVSTNVINSGTVKDENNFSVKVVVMDNFKKYLNNVAGEGDTIDSLKALVEWVEDRDTDGSVKDSTIIGVIRQNLTASGAVLYNNEINVMYEDFIDNAETPIVKATITFTAQSRSNRN